MSDFAAMAIVFGAIGLVSLVVVVRSLVRRSRRRRRLQRLEERIEVLPSEVRESLREKMARHLEETPPEDSGLRRRDARWERFLTKAVADAEGTAKIHEALSLMGRLASLDRRIGALPEEARRDLRKRLREYADETLPGIPEAKKRDTNWEQFAAVAVAAAEINVHLPLDRRLLLSTRFEALPPDRRERVTTRLALFTIERLPSISDAKTRSRAWEIRYEELLAEAEAGIAAASAGRPAR